MFRTSVVQSLSEARKTKDRPVLHYYVEQASQHDLNASAILRSFIRQLLLDPRCVAKHHPKTLLSKVEGVFALRRSFIHEIELLELLDYLLMHVPDVIFVIDGLHEMLREEAERVCDYLVHFLKEVKVTILRIAIFSRNRVGDLLLARRLSPSWHVELNMPLVANDIERFVDRSVDDMMQKERTLTQDSAVVSHIKRELIDHGSEMLGILSLGAVFRMLIYD